MEFQGQFRQFLTKLKTTFKLFKFHFEVSKRKKINPVIPHNTPVISKMYHTIKLEPVVNLLFLNGPFPAYFSLFLSFQRTVDSKQMFNINKFLPITGFEPQTSGIGSTALPTEPHNQCPSVVNLIKAL